MTQYETTPGRITRTEKFLGSGSAVSAVGGACVAALSIIGLAGAGPHVLLAIACIVAGAVFALSAGALGAEGRRARAEEQPMSFAAGASAEMIGGLLAVTLGILALIFASRPVGSPVLSSIAAIVLGCTMLLGSAVPARASVLGWGTAAFERAGEGATAVRGAVGVGAVALGVLALVGVARTDLALIALLAIGGAQLLTGTALFAGTAYRHAHAH